MATNGTAANGAIGQEKPKYGDMRDYMAPTLWQPHNARQALRDAHEKKIPPLLGWYAGMSSIPVARWMAPSGYDCVWIDWEHTSCNTETMTTLVHETMFMSGGKTIPFVRVPGHDHAAIGWALDAGASIVIPQVETVAEAQHVVSSAKFGSAQRGTRSAPPTRFVFGVTDMPMIGNDLHKSVNQQAAIVIQIETLEAIKNLDAILTEVPDIDAVWLGSLDARVSMNLKGGFGFPMEEPEWLDAVKLFFDTMKKHDKPYSGFSLASGEKMVNETKDMCMAYIALDAMALMSLYQGLGDARAAIAASREAK